MGYPESGAGIQRAGVGAAGGRRDRCEGVAIREGVHALRLL
ncbi:MAG: hypothetical protein H6R24_2531, partial [Proteobacteria bacterium]|nr:hypothetical protein [Pseudomonadota bacterium]